jgi:transcriptional regulator with XRE-family HTH domain
MALGMIQKTLAEKTGFPSSQISRLEKGDYVSMKFAQLVTLADALKTSVDYLLGREDDPGEVPDELNYAIVG